MNEERREVTEMQRARILEAMTDMQFRAWAGRLITTVAGYYIIYGSWLMLARSSAAAF